MTPVDFMIVEYEVRAIHKRGIQTWKWPEQVDQIWYKNQQMRRQFYCVLEEKHTLFLKSSFM